jgi:hypothetical protein
MLKSWGEIYQLGAGEASPALPPELIPANDTEWLLSFIAGLELCPSFEVTQTLYLLHYSL